MAGAKIYEGREQKRENKLSQPSTAALVKGLDQWKMSGKILDPDFGPEIPNKENWRGWKKNPLRS